jgi:pimeloyl-ACP methyl ester carboxylesterase
LKHHRKLHYFLKQQYFYWRLLMNRSSRQIFTKVIFAAAAAALVCGTALAAPAKLERKILKHDGLTTEVFAQGKGPIIVILPSLGRSVRDYDAVSANLAKAGFRVIRPEPRGIGASKGPMEKQTMHDFAKGIAYVIEAQKKGPVVVVGHAWGNFEARQLATDRPDLVRGVVIAAGSAGKVPADSKEVPINADMRKAIDGAGDLTLSDAQRLEYLKIAFFAPGNDATVWMNGWYPATNEAESWARNNTPVDDYFAGGSAPILDLQAEDDPVAPRRFAGVLKSMVGDRVEIVVIPHASHALAPEQPQAMSDAIAAFAHRVYAKPAK